MESWVYDMKNLRQFMINAQSLYTLHLSVKRQQQILFLHQIAIFGYIFLSADFWSGPELALATLK